MRVITLREDATCVLSSLGADAPGIHQPNREDH